MPDERVEAVHRICAAWERGEWAAGGELFEPGVEVVYSTTAFPDAGTYRGGSVALAAWTRWLEAWEEFNMELEDVIDAGADVVALSRLRARGRASGVAVDADVGIIFDFHLGLIRRMVFCDRNEALKAAGLRA